MSAHGAVIKNKAKIRKYKAPPPLPVVDLEGDPAVS